MVQQNIISLKALEIHFYFLRTCFRVNSSSTKGGAENFEKFLFLY